MTNDMPMKLKIALRLTSSTSFNFPRIRCIKTRQKENCFENGDRDCDGCKCAKNCLHAHNNKAFFMYSETIIILSLVHYG